MKLLGFLRQNRKFIPLHNDLTSNPQEEPIIDEQKTLRIVSKNIAELDCLKKVFTSVYCKCPICSSSEFPGEKYSVLILYSSHLIKEATPPELFDFIITITQSPLWKVPPVRVLVSMKGKISSLF